MLAARAALLVSTPDVLLKEASGSNRLPPFQVTPELPVALSVPVESTAVVAVGPSTPSVSCQVCAAVASVHWVRPARLVPLFSQAVAAPPAPSVHRSGVPLPSMSAACRPAAAPAFQVPNEVWV